MTFPEDWEGWQQMQNRFWISQSPDMKGMEYSGVLKNDLIKERFIDVGAALMEPTRDSDVPRDR